MVTVQIFIFLTQSVGVLQRLLTLLLPSNVLTSFTLGVNLTPAIKTSRKLLELILFPKFKCQVLYVCLLTT